MKYSQTNNDRIKSLPVVYATLLAKYGYPDSTWDYSAQDLITIWRGAIDAYRDMPDNSNNIAIETMSIGSSSRLINTNEKFENIHYTFGELEVPAAFGDEHEWKQLEADIESLAKDLNL